ncbi:Ribonuclease, partial [Globisporangium polare]
GKNQLSAIRSCFEKVPDQQSVGPFNPIDCAPAAKASATVPCDAGVPLTLLAYSPPQ